jgi:thiamine biosynthesis lipoprotein
MKRMIAVILACLLLAGCSASAPVTKQYFVMDTLMTFTIYDEDALGLYSAVSDLMSLLEDEWSVMDKDSILSQLNRGQTPELDADPTEFLKRVEELSERTGGIFDPKLYSVSAAWGFIDGNGRVPTDEQIQTALADKKWDLGAAVKGYAGQEAVKLLQELGAERALMDLGGNIQTFGSKADGSPWRIGIKDPAGGTANLCVVSVEGTMSIVTSGDYERYFELDGKKYHHIMDPKTGKPAQSGLSSVTVICADGLTADVLSTALFVMGLEKGSEFWRNSNDFEALFVTQDGKLYATEGVALSDCEFEVIYREN